MKFTFSRPKLGIAKPGINFNSIGQSKYVVINMLENQDYTPDFCQKFTIADMIMGFVLTKFIRYNYDIYEGGVKQKFAVIQVLTM